MPYADPQAARDYARAWHARRRAAFFDGRACVDCGAVDDLQLDHVDGEKVHHNIWSWSQKRRDAELAKCVVRCGPCHRARHAAERRRHGIKRYQKGCRCGVCRAAKAKSNARTRKRRTPMTELVMVQRAHLPEHTAESEPLIVDTATPGVARLILDDGTELVADRVELLAALQQAAA